MHMVVGIPPYTNLWLYLPLLSMMASQNICWQVYTWRSKYVEQPYWVCLTVQMCDYYVCVYICRGVNKPL